MYTLQINKTLSTCSDLIVKLFGVTVSYYGVWEDSKTYCTGRYCNVMYVAAASKLSNNAWRERKVRIFDFSMSIPERVGRPGVGIASHQFASAQRE